jgi:hypothetical protein
MVQEFLAKDGKHREYGALGVITHAYPAVVATAGGSTILAYSANTVYILLSNRSGVTITVTLEGTTPTTALGIPILDGADYEMSPAYGNLPTGAIKGISASGAVNVFLTSATGV